MKYTLKKIGVRFLVLIVPILILVAWHFLAFNPHKRCVGNEHRHVDGFLGVAMFSLIWFYGWLIFILLEIIYLLIVKYFKRNA